MEGSLSEFLALRLSNRAQQTIPWVVYSPTNDNIIASGELAAGASVAELQKYTQNRQVIGILDSSEVSYRTLTVPKGSSRQIHNMLPFLLEDELAQESDELHISVLGKQNQTISVAVLDKKKVEYWIEYLAKFDIQFNKLVPDVLALQAHSTEFSPSLLELGSQWVVNHAQFSGAVVEAEHLPLILQGEHFDAYRNKEEGNAPASLYVYQAPNSLWQGGDLHWQAAEPELPILVLAKGAIKCSVDLLKQLYRTKPSWHKQVKIWRSAIIAMLVLAMIWGGRSVWELRQAEQQLADIIQQREQVVTQVLQNKRKIPTFSRVKRLMNDEVTRLNNGGSDNASYLFNHLVELPNSVQSLPNIKITSLKYEAKRDELKLDVMGGDFQVFEQIREKLSQSYQVELGPLNKDGTQVKGQFILRSQP